MPARRVSSALESPVRLSCTLLDGRTGLRRDLEVTAPRGATLAELLAAAGRTGHDEAAVDGVPVATDRRLAVPPLVHGCLLTLGSSAPPQPEHPGLVLDVVSGPDAGRSLSLTPGVHVVGRGESVGLKVDDPDMSRRHAALTVTSDRVVVRDLDSSNGTWLQPTRRLPAEPVRLAVGERLLLGSSGLTTRVPTGRPASTRVTGTGLVEVNRPPSTTPPLPQVLIETPSLGAPEAPAGMPWVGMAVPLVLSLGAAWLLRQPTYLLFGLMSPLVLLTSAASDRVTRRRRRRRRQEQWHGLVRAAECRATQACAEETAALRRLAGDPVTLLRAARVPTSRVWERGLECPDLLRVSVGTGDVPSRTVSWTDAAATDGWAPPEPVLTDAPVTVDLVALGHLGVCGSRDLVLRITRWVLGQLTVQHGPGAVQLAFAVDDHCEWSWARWLPHLARPTCSAADDVVGWLDETVGSRRAERGGRPWTGRRLVVVVDSPSACRLRGVATLLRDGPDVGVHVIHLAATRTSLPTECRAIVSVADDARATLDLGNAIRELRVDGTRRPWAEAVARALAPLVDTTPVPESLRTDVALLDVLPLDPRNTDDLAEHWRNSPRSSSAAVGRDLDGPYQVDLVADGPHVLVAGTTGAGKSELLRTLVVSLAVGNRPDELSFVLVDYKGGAAFQECADLVHTAGLVTDLDESLAARALLSLDSELRRREAMLNEAGCRDVTEYQSLRDGDHRLPPLPRLVIVIDEFRVLAAELPAFLDGVVHVASVGRSLGVHVVLATQRPAGVVTADIKANVNLRICLRVRDRHDSDDVLDDGGAASISAATPGRALVRRGGQAPAAVQVAHVEEERQRLPERVEVRQLPDDRLPSGVGEPRMDRGGEAGVLRQLVESCRIAALRLGCSPARPVWMPPLPDALPVDELPVADGQVDDRATPLGLVDLPAQQLQQTLVWHPVTSGHLAVAGAARTGRTSALLALVSGLATRWSPTELHVHVIDAGAGSLGGLRVLPHVGTVVPADEPRRAARLIRRLAEEVAERRRTPSRTQPALLLVLDGWEALAERLEDVDHGRPLDELLAVVRDGESCGLRAVVTGARGVLHSRVAAVISERLLLRPNDPTDLLLAGIAPSNVPRRQPAGRAVRGSDGSQVQLVGPPSSDHLAEAASCWPSWSELPASGRAFRMRPLPSVVDSGPLATGGQSRTWALVGRAGDEAVAAGIDVAHDRCTVVVGPPGSGRSTTLLTMATCLHSQGVEVVAVCPTPSPLAHGPWRTVRPDGAPCAMPSGTGHQVVVVDDVERLRDHPWEAQLVSLLDRPDRSVVMAGTTAALLGSFRGLTGLGRLHRTGVLLQPASAADGDVLGIRAEVEHAAPVGRGLLVVRGDQRPVQVARTDPDNRPAARVRSAEIGRRSVGATT